MCVCVCVCVCVYVLVCVLVCIGVYWCVLYIVYIGVYVCFMHVFMCTRQTQDLITRYYSLDILKERNLLFMVLSFQAAEYSISLNNIHCVP